MLVFIWILDVNLFGGLVAFRETRQNEMRVRSGQIMES